jgi:hypothetical protein
MADKMFTLFPKLPIELRLLIWEMALPGPRVLKTSLPWDLDAEIRWNLTPSEKSPAILFSCHESRTVALNHYQPLSYERLPFGANFQYFDPSIDILFHACYLSIFDSLDTRDVLSLIAACIPGLQRLAIAETIFYHHNAIDGHRMAAFGCLEELILVRGEDVDEDIRDVSFIDTLKRNSEQDQIGFGLTARVAGLRKTFAELEKSNTGWNAPRVWSGRLIRKGA